MFPILAPPDIASNALNGESADLIKLADSSNLSFKSDTLIFKALASPANPTKSALNFLVNCVPCEAAISNAVPVVVIASLN